MEQKGEAIVLYHQQSKHVYLLGLVYPDTAYKYNILHRNRSCRHHITTILKEMFEIYDIQTQT